MASKISARDYLLAFATPEGRRVLADLKASLHDRISFDADPYTTAFNEGKRAVYMRITDKMRMAKNTKLLKQIEGDIDE